MKMMQLENLKKILDEKVDLFNNKDFITYDPISIPHQFFKLQDIEIAGFFAAILAWGNRTSILKSCNRLMEYMDKAPHDFVLNFEEKDFIPMQSFVHRTFNAYDLQYFLYFLKCHYRKETSLETAFLKGFTKEDIDVENALNGFYEYFFSLDWKSDRTKKHIAAPKKKSACKRLNMFLRWMVRKDEKAVDFGIWHQIKPSQLICPLDVHSSTNARRLGLLNRSQNDWKAAHELTINLRHLDPKDPVKYDFALFGMGVSKP